MTGHLKADLSGISQMAGSLRRLADEFAALTTLAANSGDAGNAELAGALSDFATGWSDKRGQLVGQLRELAQARMRRYASTRRPTRRWRALSGRGETVGRPREWWPLSDADPVPGDPETLAGIGQHMANAAAEIESMAAALPKLSASELWDSAAGQQFRDKAAATAAGIGKAHGRFRAVATALGSSTYGGTGYAAALQACQEQADAAVTAVTAVNGTLSSSGSEMDRRRAWTALLDATGGLDPTRPVPQPVTGTAAGPLAVLSPHPLARMPAGPFPQASPGVIPPYLPSFADDPATVSALKRTYNTTIDTLAASARTISQASAAQAAAAHSAAQLIRTAIDADGLNNPSGFMHWLDHAVDDITGYVSAHWAGFTRDLADIAGEIATECGIIAMVLAFIPGMQEFAAAFETIALLAQFISFACHVALLASGQDGLLDVAVDGIGLVTFGASSTLRSTPTT